MDTEVGEITGLVSTEVGGITGLVETEVRGTTGLVDTELEELPDWCMRKWRETKDDRKCLKELKTN